MTCPMGQCYDVNSVAWSGQQGWMHDAHFSMICHETAGKRGEQPLEGSSTWTTSRVPHNGRDLPGTQLQIMCCWENRCFPVGQSYHPESFHRLPYVQKSEADVMLNKPDLLRGRGLFKSMCYSPLPFGKRKRKKLPLSPHSQHNNNSLSVMRELLSISFAFQPPQKILSFSLFH